MCGLRVSVVVGLIAILVTGLLSVTAVSASPNGVVISEFRFRGPAGGNDEFVEFFNTSAGEVNISGYKLQGCASTSGSLSDRTTVPDGTVLKAGQHYLFTNSGSSGYSGSVSGDRTYSTGFTDLQAGNQSGARLISASGATIDGVGSPASPCREGVGITTPTTNADNSFERKNAGRQDTDDNAVDFEGPKAGSPQNSGSDPTPPEPEITPIHEILGPGAESSFAGETVTIEGVVTGVDDEIGASFGTGNSIRRFPEDAGIFIQEEQPDADQNPDTSEGVFVGFVRDRNAYEPGDVVRVNGRVGEKFGQTILSETIKLGA